jgi:hypothetical protein
MKTVKITYEQCLDHIKDWESLGKGFVTFDQQVWGETRRVVFRHWNQGTTTRTEISVWNDSSDLRVTFPSGRERIFPINALPVKPFRQREVQQVWGKFLAMLSVPEMEDMHGRYDYNN